MIKKSIRKSLGIPEKKICISPNFRGKICILPNFKGKKSV